MRCPRFYYSDVLQKGGTVTLGREAHRHALQVLRLRVGDALTLFNGGGGEYDAVLCHADNTSAMVEVGAFHALDRTSPRNIHLGQALLRGDKMDAVIQTSVMLGVRTITPIITERCNVKLQADRLQRRLQHWRNIIISACEQSGLNRLPQIAEPQRIGDWVRERDESLRFIFHPSAERALSAQDASASVAALIGPEGGFSEQEVAAAVGCAFQVVSLGPRVLRTETAPVVALSLLQCDDLILL